jgi:CubicO group peptidase (beta-lactamase class C family)
VVRHGVLAFESRTFNVMPHALFDLWSCTKSFTGLCYALLFDAAQRGELGPGAPSPGSRAYDLIPEGQPLTDPRKAGITLEQLLTMTAGFAGAGEWMAGTPTAIGDGMFEFALGRCPNVDGASAAVLARDPGADFGYSDAGFSHLSLAFAAVMGRELDEVLAERILGPIGVPAYAWPRAGGGHLIGPHTIPHTGLCLSSRSLARVGLLLLNNGNWDGRQLLPPAWLGWLLEPSPHNPAYARTFWTNAGGALWPGLPHDLYGMFGFNSNRLYVIPSADLVIARAGAGPGDRDEQGLLEAVLAGLAD